MHTSICSPSQSLIKEILEPNFKSQLKLPAIQWGIKHEHNAREQYLSCKEKEHAELRCTASGLCINLKHPHLGANPDGVVKCKCCGKGLLKTKCPFKHKERHPHDATDNKYCFQPDKGQTFLKHSHEYYIQVQGLIAVCEADYCDFVCWTPKGTHIERILPDLVLFGEVIKPALDNLLSRFSSHTHVERVNGLLKNKYTILQSILPVTMLRYNKECGTSVNVVDEVAHVCAALINLCPSVVDNS